MATSSPTAGHATHVPNYVRLHERGELARRTGELWSKMSYCELCPRRCRANRLSGQAGACHVAEHAFVATWFAHRGEERCISGTRGSGTMFFQRCNLECVFCQNADLSQADASGEMAPSEIASIMLKLQDQGCHNINLVSPDHVVPQILAALAEAAAQGLRIPIVHNGNGYTLPETLRVLTGVIDIYMPDVKTFDERTAKRLLAGPRYPRAVKEALREMHRQMGDLVVDDRGIAQRGLLARHLILPGQTEDVRKIMAYLASLSRETAVHLMPQYHPDYLVGHGRFEEIHRRPNDEEIAAAKKAALEAGLHRFV